MAVLGAMTTLAVWVYDLRNNQHYDALIGQAAMLEHDLGVPHGSFSHRPKTWATVGTVAIEHRWPIALIYATSLAAWLSVLLYAWLCHRNEPIWVRFAVAGSLPISVIGVIADVIRSHIARQQEEERAKVKAILGRLEGRTFADVEHDDQWQMTKLGELLDWPKAAPPQTNADPNESFWTHLRAVGAYAGVKDGDKIVDVKAALMTAYLTDLPFHWIRAAVTRRRRAKAARLNYWLVTLLSIVAALSVIAWLRPGMFIEVDPKFPSLAPTPTFKCTPESR